MTRPWMTWLAFLLCVAVVSAAMGWISLTALQLERAERETTVQSENERLALWRMDSALVPLITRESSRSVLDYRPFRRAEDAFSKTLKPIKSGEVRVASPLLAYESPYIVLHFQFGPEGEVTSPQVPNDVERNLAVENGYVSTARIDKLAEQLQRLRSAVSRDGLAKTLEEERVSGEQQMIVSDVRNPREIQNLPDFTPEQTQQQTADVQTGQPLPNQGAQTGPFDFQQELPQAQPQAANVFAQQFVQQSRLQQKRNLDEFQRRQMNNSANFDSPRIGLLSKAADTSAQQGPMKAVWVGEELLLARTVVLKERQYIQGCLLDWPRTKSWLAGEIKDLLPEAQLVPRRTSESDEQPLMLAALPARLVPGRAPAEPLPPLTPIRFSLLVAWVGVVLAAVAVAALLLAAVRLSERRGAFVSAVTHELRTPLTTFRMYAEMLAEGMVPDETKRKHYFETLRVEADRLGHLVENVLSYARLERNHTPTVREEVSLNDLLTRLSEPLKQRVDRAEMVLDLRCSDGPSLAVRADRAAIERIVFNLVDNACKYASRAGDRHIHLDCRQEAKQAVIRVRDHGGGISRKEAKRLFRPFSKSADEAAHSAPGVGLGLALCRRLARSMGGDLKIDHDVREGACFMLTLPLAPIEV